jgi:hypothetical protein
MTDHSKSFTFAPLIGDIFRGDSALPVWSEKSKPRPSRPIAGGARTTERSQEPENVARPFILNESMVSRFSGFALASGIDKGSWLGLATESFLQHNPKYCRSDSRAGG